MNSPVGVESIPVRDGTRLAYRLSKGNGSGRVVLIYSLAMDGSFWDRVAPLLKDHADVLVYDCRGHGQSDKPEGPYTIELFADDLADLLDRIGWRSATVCGASMGGSVAIAFAAAYPERVDGLGLFDTTCWYGRTHPRNGRSARKRRSMTECRPSSAFKKRAGSATAFATGIRTSSTAPSMCFWPMMCAVTRKPAACWERRTNARR